MLKNEGPPMGGWREKRHGKEHPNEYIENFPYEESEDRLSRNP